LNIFFVAFIAIGHTATAVGSDTKPFLDSVMAQIKLGFQMRGKKNAPSEEPMFQCVGMLAAAVGPNLTKLLHDQLELMFACGLSEPLRQAMMAIARHIPPLLKTIQGPLEPYFDSYAIGADLSVDRLLDMLSTILSGQPYRPLGSPPSVVRGDVSIIARDINASQARLIGC
jgi:FKBP12-rapamycin complex-associated protein